MQIEAVENHMPEVVIVDEIGTQEEALACRSIAERGVQLVGTAHGQVLENLLKNPAMTDLVGGIQSVTLGAQLLAAESEGCCKWNPLPWQRHGGAGTAAAYLGGG